MILKDLSIGTVVTDKKTKFNGKSILFSKDIICCKPFDNLKELIELNELDCKECSYEECSKCSYEECSTYWENSNIRNWLNTDKRKKEWRL